MPRFASRPHLVEAWQFTGTGASLPLDVARHVSNRRTGDGCEVETAEGVRLCLVGDWLVRGDGGGLLHVPAARFGLLYEPVEAPLPVDDPTSPTATFIGTPDGEHPDHVDWFGLRFPLGRAVSVSDPGAVETLRHNPHFTVRDPVVPAAPVGSSPDPIKPVPAPAGRQKGTAT